MKGIFVLCCLMVSMHYPGYAQPEVAINAGFTINRISPQTPSGYSAKYASKNGYQAGVSLTSPLRKHLSLKYGLGIIQKNYLINRTDSLNGGFTQQVNNTYIQMPVGLEMHSHIKRWFYFVDLGLFLGYWIKGTNEGYFPDIYNATPSATDPAMMNVPVRYFSQRYEFDAKKDQRISYGYMAAAGIKYELKPPHLVGVSISFYHSLSDAQKKYNSSLWPKHDQTICFNLFYALKMERLLRTKKN